MILPIIAYGDPVLKKETKELSDNYPNLQKLIEDMFETLQSANGVGLASPQIGKTIRMFIVDGESWDKEKLAGFKKVFINGYIVEEVGDDVIYNEGCLSIPEIREDIERPETIRIQYYDENFEFHDEEYEGLAARIIQHEHDHTDGILFTDHLSSLKKRLLKRRLQKITKGDIEVDYKMKFPVKKKKKKK
ncbi:MAG: peptide deformylase [Bacteroidia bacterium]|nr:peptide deformylase [Bacteroidia bacterium]